MNPSCRVRYSAISGIHSSSKNLSPSAFEWKPVALPLATDWKRTQLLDGSLCFVQDINSVAVSPDDKLIATGSQDKLAKLWTCDGFVHLGTCCGHRRGIWCVQFSPVDQILATSSADGTVKLWSLQDFSCLKVPWGVQSFIFILLSFNYLYYLI